jgi:hypothetical protein
LPHDNVTASRPCRGFSRARGSTWVPLRLELFVVGGTPAFLRRPWIMRVRAPPRTRRGDANARANSQPALSLPWVPLPCGSRFAAVSGTQPFREDPLSPFPVADVVGIFASPSARFSITVY